MFSFVHGGNTLTYPTDHIHGQCVDIGGPIPHRSVPWNTVSVKKYGAVGDGQTDDTAAIQEALNKNNSVFVDDGTYVVDGTVSITNWGSVLWGNGYASKIVYNGINLDDNDNALIRIQTDKVTVRGIAFISIGSISEPSDPKPANGVKNMNTGSRVHVIDCFFKDIPGHPIWFTGGFFCSILNCEIQITMRASAVRVDGGTVVCDSNKVVGYVNASVGSNEHAIRCDADGAISNNYVVHKQSSSSAISLNGTVTYTGNFIDNQTGNVLLTGSGTPILSSNVHTGGGASSGFYDVANVSQIRSASGNDPPTPFEQKVFGIIDVATNASGISNTARFPFLGIVPSDTQLFTVDASNNAWTPLKGGFFQITVPNVSFDSTPNSECTVFLKRASDDQEIARQQVFTNTSDNLLPSTTLVTSYLDANTGYYVQIDDGGTAYSTGSNSRLFVIEVSH